MNDPRSTMIAAQNAEVAGVSPQQIFKDMQQDLPQHLQCSWKCF